MIKLKRLMTKQENQSWQLCIDSTTTVKKDSDPRDMSGNQLTEEQSRILSKVNRFTRAADPNDNVANPGVLGWDREYIGENSVVIVVYFDTVENATLYYKRVKNPANIDTVMENEIKPNPKYRVVWYLTDEEDNIIPWSN